jgi:hypothetical protein
MIQEVGVYSSSCPTTSTLSMFMSLMGLPPSQGETYQEACDKALECCRNFYLPGPLGNAVRTLGETGNRTEVRRPFKSNWGFDPIDVTWDTLEDFSRSKSELQMKATELEIDERLVQQLADARCEAMIRQD